MPTTDKRIYKKSFRCTENENEELKKRAGHLTDSQYIRNVLFEWPDSNSGVSPDIMELLRKLEYNNLKIGTNINQIARVCNAKKNVSSKDLERLFQELNLLHYEYGQMMQRLSK